MGAPSEYVTTSVRKASAGQHNPRISPQGHFGPSVPLPYKTGCVLDHSISPRGPRPLRHVCAPALPNQKSAGPQHHPSEATRPLPGVCASATNLRLSSGPQQYPRVPHRPLAGCLCFPPNHNHFNKNRARWHNTARPLAIDR